MGKLISTFLSSSLTTRGSSARASFHSALFGPWGALSSSIYGHLCPFAVSFGLNGCEISKTQSLGYYLIRHTKEEVVDERKNTCAPKVCKERGATTLRF